MEQIVAKVADLYREVHQQLREAISGADADLLNWAPAPDTNSIAVLIVHTVGSEAEVWRTVSQTPSIRNRPAEFQTRAGSPGELLVHLDAADALLADLAPKITSTDLTAERPRGDMPTQTGLHWLLTNYGHAREHLAHIQLTTQLYHARNAS